MERNALNVAAGGGAGRRRGGFGTIREFRVLNPTRRLPARLARSLRPRPWGVDGGQPGTDNFFEVVRGNGETVRGGRVTNLPLAAGDLVRVSPATAAAGVIPSERERDPISSDVRDEYITPEIAR